MSLINSTYSASPYSPTYAAPSYSSTTQIKAISDNKSSITHLVLDTIGQPVSKEIDVKTETGPEGLTDYMFSYLPELIESDKMRQIKSLIDLNSPMEYSSSTTSLYFSDDDSNFLDDELISPIQSMTSIGELVNVITEVFFGVSLFTSPSKKSFELLKKIKNMWKTIKRNSLYDSDFEKQVDELFQEIERFFKKHQKSKAIPGFYRYSLGITVFLSSLMYFFDQKIQFGISLALSVVLFYFILKHYHDSSLQQTIDSMLIKSNITDLRLLAPYCLLNNSMTTSPKNI